MTILLFVNHISYAVLVKLRVRVRLEFRRGNRWREGEREVACMRLHQQRYKEQYGRRVTMAMREVSMEVGEDAHVNEV